MTPEELEKKKDDQEKYKAFRAALESDAFAPALAFFEKDLLAKVNAIGVNADTASAETMRTVLARYNSARTIIPQMKLFVRLFEEGEEMRAKAEAAKGSDKTVQTR